MLQAAVCSVIKSPRCVFHEVSLTQDHINEEIGNRNDGGCRRLDAPEAGKEEGDAGRRIIMLSETVTVAMA